MEDKETQSPADAVMDDQDPMAIFATMKKIKKKPKTASNNGDASSFSAAEHEKSADFIINSTLPDQTEEGEEAWLRSDRDYTYSELLTRVSKALRANNPELGGEKKKINMVLPIVNREGTKKCSFTNVMEVCKKLNRSPDHVIQFLLAELGTTAQLIKARL